MAKDCLTEGLDSCPPFWVSDSLTASLRLSCFRFALEHMIQCFVNRLSSKRFLTQLWMMLGIYGFGRKKLNSSFILVSASLYSFFWIVNSWLATIYSQDGYHQNCRKQLVTAINGIALRPVGLYSCPSELIDPGLEHGWVPSPPIGYYSILWLYHALGITTHKHSLHICIYMYAYNLHINITKAICNQIIFPILNIK